MVKRKSKKGVELSLNLVIVAVILLIVMAVSIFIFVSQTNKGDSILKSFLSDVEASKDDPKKGTLGYLDKIGQEQEKKTETVNPETPTTPKQ